MRDADAEARAKDASPGDGGEARSGQILEGRYRLDEPLGQGGLGVVWRAFHLRLQKPVAIKLMLREHLVREGLRQRFEREARSLGALSHPNIVDVMDFGLDGDQPFLVMELLEGRPLDRAIRQGLAPDRALAIGRDVLRALAHAHGLGIVHRDLKPANIFLQKLSDGSEVVRVLDFGLAKFLDAPQAEPQLTRQGMVLGTPAYMAPEQATGGSADARADVYSFGIVLFELLTGQRPFEGEGGELLRQHLLLPMPPITSVRTELQVAPELEELLRRATGKSPGSRYSNAQQVMEAMFALPVPTIVARQGTEHSAWGRESAGSIAEDRTSSGDLATSAPDRPTSAPGRPTSAPGRGIRMMSAEPPASTPPATPDVAVIPPTAEGRSPLRPGGGVPYGASAASGAGASLGAAGASGSSSTAGASGLASAAGLSRRGVRWGLVVAGGMVVALAMTITATGVWFLFASNDTVADATSVPTVPEVPRSITVPDEPPAFAVAPDPDPWADGAAETLSRIHTRLEGADSMTRSERSALRRYVLNHRADPRPWLLLARGDVLAGARTDACERYGHALDIDEALARGDAHILPDIVRMAAHHAVDDVAAGLIRQHWGARALPEIEQQLPEMARDADGRARLEALRETLALGVTQRHPTPP